MARTLVEWHGLGGVPLESIWLIAAGKLTLGGPKEYMEMKAVSRCLEARKRAV